MTQRILSYTDIEELLKEVQTLITQLKEAGGRPFIVGGAVRDKILGLNPKDYDIEVFGLTEEELVKALEKYAKHPVEKVGESFGVYKVGDLDIALPRREKKAGKGYKGFEITVDFSEEVSWWFDFFSKLLEDECE